MNLSFLSANITPENPILYYSISILVTILIGSFLLFLSVVKKAKKARYNDIMAKFQNKELLFFSKNSSFFGHKLKNYTQVRGNGYFALTKDEIYFLMWLPPKEIKINIDKITKIDFPKSFLGKSIFKPLLRVTYINDNKELDEVAWAIRELPKIKSELLKLKLIK